MLHIEKSAVMFSLATVVEIEKVYFSFFLREKMLLLSCLRAQIGLSAHNFFKINFFAKKQNAYNIYISPTFLL